MNIDFSSLYKKGDTLFYANIEEALIRKIKLRTVDDTYMVGVVNKSDVIFIGKDKINRLFTSMLDANLYLDSLGKNAKLDIEYDIPDQLLEMGGEDE